MLVKVSALKFVKMGTSSLNLPSMHYNNEVFNEMNFYGHIKRS